MLLSESMDGDEKDVGRAESGAVGVDTADSFGQGDIGFFGDQKFCVKAASEEFRDDAGGDDAVVAVFEEFAVGAAFAGGVGAVAVVDEDFHWAVRWESLQLSDSDTKVRKNLSKISANDYNYTMDTVKPRLRLSFINLM